MRAQKHWRTIGVEFLPRFLNQVTKLTRTSYVRVVLKTTFVVLLVNLDLFIDMIS